VQKDSPKPGMIVFVTIDDVMASLGCERRTARRYLSEARAGRPGKTTLQQWNLYAWRKWGPGLEPPEPAPATPPPAWHASIAHWPERKPRKLRATKVGLRKRRAT
jgi:hypothetical protein